MVRYCWIQQKNSQTFRPGQRPPVGEDCRGDHSGVGPLHRHLPLSVEDVPPARSEIPRTHSQLQQPMVSRTFYTFSSESCRYIDFHGNDKDIKDERSAVCYGEPSKNGFGLDFVPIRVRGVGQQVFKNDLLTCVKFPNTILIKSWDCLNQ